MKLYNKEDFLKLPSGTLFLTVDKNESGYRIEEDLKIKGNTINDDDFRECYPFMLNNEIDLFLSLKSVWLDVESYAREGLYNNNIKYIVLEKFDLIELQRIINEALENYR